MTRFQALLRERAPDALALALALVAAGMLRVSTVIQESPGQPFLGAALEQLANWSLLSLMVVAVIAAFEAGRLQGFRRLCLQAIALAAATVLYARFVGTSPMLTVQFHRLGLGDDRGLAMYLAWLGWAMSGLLSWYYWAQENSIRAAANLQVAELRRHEAEREVLESRLRALEAQVEPRFLLDALARLQALYERDPVEGHRSLDDLIDYLRTALPQVRDRASTLEREFALVSAYLRVASPASMAATAVALPAPLAHHYAPPMVLLPLAQLGLDSHPLGAGPREFAMAAHAADGRTVVSAGFQARSGFDPSLDAQAIRDTLALLFGEEGRFEIRRDADRYLVELSWPAHAECLE